MSIETGARQEAERRWPHTGNGGDLDSSRSVRRLTFVQGAVWAREQADRELSAAEVRDALYFALRDAGEGRTTAENLSRKLSAALLAAQEVRRG